MKKQIFSAFAILLMVLNVSCSGDDKPSSSELINDLRNVITQNQWRVTNFSENGTNQTSQFSGFVFSFTAQGGVIAASGDTNVPGTWSTATDDSKPKFVLQFFATSGSFEEISEDWEILHVSNVEIRLRHISGGDGSVDLLTFRQN